MIAASIRWLVTVVCLSVLLTWCLLNRDLVSFDWSPTRDAARVPLFLIIVAVALIGFLWGVVIAWLDAWQQRSALRQLRRAHDDLVRQLAAVRPAPTIIDDPAAILPPPPKTGWNYWR